MINEKLIERIQKLQAKAESANELGNVEESIAFSTKVQELLLKHNLEMSDIDVELTPDINELSFANVSREHNQWRLSLLTVIAKYNFCEVIYSIKRKLNKKFRYVKEKTSTPTIIGQKENVEIVKYLYDILSSQFDRFAKQSWKANVKELKDQASMYSNLPPSHITAKNFKLISNKAKKVYLKSFLIGAVQGVRARLEEKQQVANARYGNKMTDLMIVHDSEIQKYMDTHYSDATTAKSRRVSINGNAYNSGHEAGRNANMARGISTGESVAVKSLN